jgi:TPR repeat protein
MKEKEGMGFFKDLFKMDPEVDFQMALRAETFENNYKKAAWLYGKATEQNHLKAQFFLALMYLKGRGVDKDLQKAFELATKSASQGFYKAQYLLAQMYLRGVGVQQNVAEGNRWMGKFKAQGRDARELSFLDSELKFL